MEKDLGGFLRDKRKELGLSLRQASALMGISHSYLDKIEKTVTVATDESDTVLRPSADAIKAIATAYNVNYDYLLELCGYIDKNDSSLVRIGNPDILMISRAEQNMTATQAEMLRKYAQYMFPEAFENISVEPPIDEN